MSIAEIIALTGLGLNVMVAAIGLTWGLAKIRDTIRDEIDSHRIKFDDELDSVGRSFGESLAAIREKIREVELFCRDTFLRRDSFYEVTKGVTADLKALSDRIETRLERMEAKIDSRNGH